MYDWTTNIIIKCGCYNEALSLAYDKDIESLDLAIYSSYSVADHNRSWRYFVRLAWHWVRRGRIYSDQMVLEKEEIIKLRNYLNSLDVKN